MQIPLSALVFAAKNFWIKKRRAAFLEGVDILLSRDLSSPFSVLSK
jgi:hypothetical protein